MCPAPEIHLASREITGFADPDPAFAVDHFPCRLNLFSAGQLAEKKLGFRRAVECYFPLSDIDFSFRVDPFPEQFRI